MAEIRRQNPYLEEILVELDQKLEKYGGDPYKTQEYLTKSESQWIDDELGHCMADTRYFISNYYAYRDEEEGFKSLYPMFDSQEILHEEYERIKQEKGGIRAIINKSRQMGVTTYNIAKLFKETIFSDHIQSIIVGPDDKKTKNFMAMYESALDFIPWWMRPRIKQKQTGVLINFDEKDESLRLTRPGLKSWLYAENAVSPTGAGRSFTFQRAFLSEVAYWPDGKQLVNSLFPTFNTTDGFYVMESTANGRNDHWHNFWRRAEAGKINWVPIFIPFYRRDKTYSMPIEKGKKFNLTKDEVELRDRILKKDKYFIKDEVFNWVRQKKEEFAASGEEYKFAEAYPIEAEESFQTSGITKFSRKRLTQLSRRTMNPIWVGEIDLGGESLQPWKLIGDKLTEDQTVPYPEEIGTRFQIFEMPQKGAKYCVAADVALGNPGADYSCVQVIKDGEQMDMQVACWHGYINPAAYANIIYAIAKMYNEALVAVEVNSYGIQTNYELMTNLEYDNLYRYKRLDKMTRQLTDYVGFLTTPKSKDGLEAKMAEYLMEDCIDIPCKWTVDEFSDYTGDRDTEEEGSHDDMTMALMIALYCLHEGEPRKKGGDKPRQNAPEEANTFWVVDQRGNIVTKTHSQKEAEKTAKMHLGSVINRRAGKTAIAVINGETKKVPADFQNTDFSPIHDKQGTAHKLHYDEGVPEDEITQEMIQEYEALEESMVENDPEAWRWL